MNCIMKTVALLLGGLLALSFSALAGEGPAKKPALRHVVLFKFKAAATAEQIRQVEAAFKALPKAIPQIVSLEWGTNVSPEKLDKGFTHAFILTFQSDQDRDDYLVHPDHQAFGKTVGPVLEDVLVVDFWVKP